MIAHTIYKYIYTSIIYSYLLQWITCIVWEPPAGQLKHGQYHKRSNLANNFHLSCAKRFRKRKVYSNITQGYPQSMRLKGRL